MDLGSTNGIWVNRSKITPFKEVNLFPGDVICLAEPNICFQVLTGNHNEDANVSGLATRHGLRIAEALESDAASRGIFAPSLPAGSDVSKSARLLMTNNEHQAAYMLLLGEVMKNPSNPGTWAQLAALERQRSRRRLQNSTAGTVRAFLRAAVEGYESITNEEERRLGLAKVFKSWAQLEFDVRNDGPARILFQKSLQCSQKLKDIDYSKPEMAKTLFTWASREWKLNNVIVAAKLCKQALDSDPKNPYVLTLLGRLYCSIGDYDSARNMFRMALLSSKKHISALQAWGAMEASQKKLEKARILFKTALSVDPKNQFITQAWAVAEGNAGNMRNASTLFAKCVEDHPDCRAAWHGWAKLEDEQGSKVKARELYHKVLELKPKSKRTLAALGRLERLEGNLDIAEGLLRKALHFDSQHAASLQELAMLLKQKKQLNEAHALEKKVRRINAAQRTQLSRVRQMKMEFLDD
jgi:tetratricopeptide (TPR) repeat protein